VTPIHQIGDLENRKAERPNRTAFRLSVFHGNFRAKIPGGSPVSAADFRPAGNPQIPFITDENRAQFILA
jgi:hypothetical protein